MNSPLEKIIEDERQYFIDEAGCTTLFNKFGKIIIGQEGVSKAFILGVSWVQDVKALEKAFDELRADLLVDSYFSQVPSMQPQAKKTALAFHCKDDIAEVRWRVFEVLKTIPCKTVIAFRRKTTLVELSQKCKKLTGQSFPDTHIYDNLVSRTLETMLHQADSTITFSRRGKTSRQNALFKAVQHAKGKFEKKNSIVNKRNINVQVAAPHEFAGLQLVDYYLWALQRLLERGEDRYFNYLKDNYSLIKDLDDKRSTPYGTWYSSSKPLTLDSLLSL